MRPPSNFVCNCNDGYAGDGFTCAGTLDCDPNLGLDHSCFHCRCAEIDACSDDLCSNGNCIDLPPPASGFNCSCHAGFQLTADNRCEEIDACADGGGCSPNALCTDLPPPSSSRECLCYEGFDGDGITCTGLNPLIPRILISFVYSLDYVDADHDACALLGTSCTNAVCVDLPPPSTTYYCQCNTGYEQVHGRTDCQGVMFV